MVLTAIDVGYNAVKALATNGREAVFPSVVGTRVDGGFSIGDHAGLGIRIAGDDWAVGETALSLSQYTTSRRDSDWVLSDSWHTLFCTALSELHHGTVDTKIVTGLPLDDWEAWHEKVKKRVVGRHLFERSRVQTVTVKDARIITQPYGALLDMAMDSAGNLKANAFSEGRVGIIDIGGQTVNLLATKALEEIGRWTQGERMGLLTLLDNVARDIHRDHPGVYPQAREVAHWIADGEFSVSGETYRIDDYVNSRLDRLAALLEGKITEVWQEPGRFDAILLAGGGSLAIGGKLRKKMDGKYPQVIQANEAQLSNVRGYLKLARRLWD